MAAVPAPRPMLLTCALGIERLALRGVAKGAAGGSVVLLRTGMGPVAAEQSVTRLLARSGPAATPLAVLATGFCAGLESGMRPGDLVVADETREVTGRTVCDGAPALADAVRARVGTSPRRSPLVGRTVHTGPMMGSDRVVRGAERVRLAATGAIAVDMESAATLRAATQAGPCPVAAVRVVVDAPEHELVRMGTLRGGITAFRVLRAVLPAFIDWQRSLLLPRR